jgi:cephalosporin hydroxylase
VRIVKLPNDLILFAEVIQAQKPRWIIEAGTKFGGSALFFQDMLDLVGEGGRVVTIDKYPAKVKHDPRINYIEDSSTNTAVVSRIREMVGNDTVMVVLDSDHSRVHVKWELKYYAPIVTPGQYLVVEDCYNKDAQKAGPGEAVDWFLRVDKNFEQTNYDNKYLVGFCRGGWLRRKK